jgi:hypothetical protein
MEDFKGLTEDRAGFNRAAVRQSGYCLCGPHNASVAAGSSAMAGQYHQGPRRTGTTERRAGTNSVLRLFSVPARQGFRAPPLSSLVTRLEGGGGGGGGVSFVTVCAGISFIYKKCE